MRNPRQHGALVRVQDSAPRFPFRISRRAVVAGMLAVSNTIIAVFITDTRAHTSDPLTPPGTLTTLAKQFSAGNNGLTLATATVLARLGAGTVHFALFCFSHHSV